MIKILPYKRGSRSARNLARKIGALRIVTPGYRQKRRDLIVNWGATHPAQNLWNTTKIINRPDAVRLAANKLEAFRRFQVTGIPCPEWTTDQSQAQAWGQNRKTVFARTILNGHSGRGIIVVEPGEMMPYAPLYTKYVVKDSEFRVHVFQGRIIDFVRKKRRNGYEQNLTHNDRIRNLDNGWVFCREGVTLPAVVQDVSLRAVAALGLDFGAVDIAYRADSNRVWVYEVNTAPGLEGTTLEKYAQVVRGLV